MCRSGFSRSADGEQVGHERRPEVLVLDVDQPTRPGEHLAIGVGDAAFPDRCEWIAAQPGRIRPQHLHRVRSGRLGLRQRLRKIAPDELAGVVGPVDQHPHRARQIQNRAAVPPFPKRVLEIGYCRAPDGSLHVMPRRMLSVRGREFHRLPIAQVGRVVVPAPTEVDAAEEGDVAFGATRTAHDDQFLMVRSGSARARVEQHLATGVRQLPREFGILALALVAASPVANARSVRIRAPRAAPFRRIPHRRKFLPRRAFPRCPRDNRRNRPGRRARVRPSASRRRSKYTAPSISGSTVLPLVQARISVAGLRRSVLVRNQRWILAS